MIRVDVDERWIKEFIHYGKGQGKRIFYSRAVPELIFDEILRISPFETGHFYSKWKIVNQGEGSIAFENQTEYAGVIDRGGYRGVGSRTVKGRGGGIFSRQAPEGITYPIIKEFGEGTVSKKMEKRIKLMLERGLRKWGFTTS